VLRQQPSDPISGSSPLRASVCNVTRLAVTKLPPVSHALDSPKRRRLRRP
jgi:hypothetical protein